MQSISNAMNRVVASWGPEAAAALKRARNKERYRAAVLRTWRTRPEAANLVLRHTCSIFIAKDDRPRKGPEKDKDRWIFGLYLNDAMVRTEVDAWQSVLLQALRYEGISVDEIRILPATRDMRQRQLFPELEEEAAVAQPPVSDCVADDRSRALDIVKTATVLAFGDTERAWAFLERVQLASLEEVLWNAPEEDGCRECPSRRQGSRQYWLVLYVDDVEGMELLVGAFGDAIRSQARLLGLRIRAISVRSGEGMDEGLRAFSRQEHSRALGGGYL